MLTAASPDERVRAQFFSSDILPAMVARTSITIVGAGNFGGALAVSLYQAGFLIDEIVIRPGLPAQKSGRALARKVGGCAVTYSQAKMTAEMVWLCVPDSQIAQVARRLAKSGDWKGRVVLHSSGALSSGELGSVRRLGAAVASLHPLMTFVHGTQPAASLWKGTSFAIEGDASGIRAAHAIVKRLGGIAYPIRKQDKAAYHAWGTFASPLLTALLAATEQVAAAAGVRGPEAKKRVLPILQQTLAHYAAFGAAEAFSGPLVRGDVAIVKQHLQVLRKTPPARDVYLALARAACAYLPVKKRRALQKLLR
jgi:predicted short-subunit dehydrogenase-like oxidoreductase (DUF2520 family)